MTLFLVCCLVGVIAALVVVGGCWEAAADRAAIAEGEAKLAAAEATGLRSRVLGVERERDTAKREAGVLRGNAERSAEALARAFKRVEGLEAAHGADIKRLEAEVHALKAANDRQARLLGTAGELARAIVSELSC